MVNIVSSVTNPRTLEDHLRCFPASAFSVKVPQSADPIFDAALQTVFLHEGIFSDDADDPGGPTKYGISLRLAEQIGDLDGDGHLDLDLDCDGDVDVGDIRMMTPDHAATVYYNLFWRKDSGLLPACIGIKRFNLAVNMGTHQANKLLQRAARSCTGEALIDDGLIGPVTRAAVRESHPLMLLSALRSEAAGFYRLLIAQRPSAEKYRSGWLNRAYF